MSSTKSLIPRPSAEVLRALYVDQHLGCPEIGRRFERDAKTVLWWLQQAGIPTRPRGSDTAQHFKAGQPSAFAGRTHTAESIAKVRAATLADGRVPFLRNGQHWLKDAPPEENPNWRGGATPERQEFYRSPAWKAACCYVWARDDACCRNCGKDYRVVDRAVEPAFHVHHVWSFQIPETRANPALLVLLCRPCHLWVHSKANLTRAWLPQEFGTTHFPNIDAAPPPFDVDRWIESEARGRAAYARSINLKAAEQKVSMPSLFDALEAEAEAA